MVATERSRKIAIRSLIIVGVIVVLTAVFKSITWEVVQAIIIGVAVGAVIGVFGIAVSRM